MSKFVVAVISIALGVVLGVGAQRTLMQQAPKPVPETPAAPTTPPSRAETSPAKATPPKEDSDPLAVVNRAFRAAYRDARVVALERSRPIIIESGGTAVLLHQGKRIEKDYIPERYHQLKAVSHIPLALFVMLLYQVDQPLSDAQRAALSTFREKVVTASDSLGQRGYPAALLDKQRQVIAESLAFLDGVKERGKVERAELFAFCRMQGPAVMELAGEASRVQLDALNACVAEWRKGMSAEEKQRLRVIVSGSTMPRRDNSAVQYFAKLLNQQGEGPRLLYAENLFDENRAVNLLGTTVIDREIGAAFFDDDTRMFRDLLGDAAREHLKKVEVR